MHTRRRFENQKDLGKEQPNTYAAQVGLDTTAFTQCLDSGKYRTQVLSPVLQGKLPIEGTPTVFVNGQMLHRGAIVQGVIEQYIERALATKRRTQFIRAFALFEPSRCTFRDRGFLCASAPLRRRGQ